MQPYIFPYIGYFQLINAVDIFVIYDDVTYIKGGYINRNYILGNQKKERFNIQLVKASSNIKINEIKINYSLNWKKKVLKQIEQNYSKAPFFSIIFNLIKKIFDRKYENISNMIYVSILEINKYLDIDTKIIESSKIYENNNFDKIERIINICKFHNCKNYINPIGGSKIYKKEAFLSHGIDLNFIESDNIWYKQYNENFIPYLSIIDVLMFNSIEEIKIILNMYKII